MRTRVKRVVHRPRTQRTTEPGEGDLLIRRAGGERRSRPYRACQAGSMTQGYSSMTESEGGWGGVASSISRLSGTRCVGHPIALGPGRDRTPSVASRGCGHPVHLLEGSIEGVPAGDGVLESSRSSRVAGIPLGADQLVRIEAARESAGRVHDVPRLRRVPLGHVRRAEVEVMRAHHRRPFGFVVGRRIQLGRRWWPTRSCSPPLIAPPGRSARPPMPRRSRGSRATLRSSERADAR